MTKFDEIEMASNMEELKQALVGTGYRLIYRHEQYGILIFPSIDGLPHISTKSSFRGVKEKVLETYGFYRPDPTPIKAA